MREHVTDAITEVCELRGWYLSAVNVRTNHVHVVVTADAPPERVMTALKASATRRLTDAGEIAPKTKIWTRHGSTRYVWDPDDVPKVMDYVLNAQEGARLEPGARPWTKREA